MIRAAARLVVLLSTFAITALALGGSHGRDITPQVSGFAQTFNRWEALAKARTARQGTYSAPEVVTWRETRQRFRELEKVVRY